MIVLPPSLPLCFNIPFGCNFFLVDLAVDCPRLLAWCKVPFESSVFLVDVMVVCPLDCSFPGWFNLVFKRSIFLLDLIVCCPLIIVDFVSDLMFLLNVTLFLLIWRLIFLIIVNLLTLFNVPFECSFFYVDLTVDCPFVCIFLLVDVTPYCVSFFLPYFYISGSNDKMLWNSVLYF